MSNIPLEERRNWIGASESAALFGVSPFTTEFQLWHEKAGNIEPDNLDFNERVMAGRHLEPSIASWANEKWGWSLTNVPEYLRHHSVAQMGASLDFITGEGEPAEIKNVDAIEFLKKFEHEGDELVDAPPHMLIQVQHQLSCPEKRPERGWLVVCAGGNRLYRMAIRPHDKLIQGIELNVQNFWDTIRAGNPPSPDYQLDAEVIGMLYGGTNEFKDLRQDERAVELCREYFDAHAIEREAKKRKNEARAEIIDMVDDARLALIGDTFKFSSSWIKPATIERKGHFRFNLSEPKNR